MGNGGNGPYVMYGNTSARVVVGGVLLSGSFYMCLTVECILCSENVYPAHCGTVYSNPDAVVNALKSIRVDTIYTKLHAAAG